MRQGISAQHGMATIPRYQVPQQVGRRGASAGGEAAPGAITLEKRREYHRTRRSKNIAAGLCGLCQNVREDHPSLCKKHHEQYNAKLISMRKPRIKPSLTERVQKYTLYVGDCIVWTGAVTSAGYGELNVGGRPVLAHRISYELSNGPIPAGLVINHLCTNKVCVNPAHLELTTYAGNAFHDNSKNITKANIATTHCPNGHPYDEENTYIFKNKRDCRACWRKPFRSYR